MTNIRNMPRPLQALWHARLATWWLWRQPGTSSGERHLSPILLRILAVNSMALVILVGSLLYLGRYQDRIIATQLSAMTLQARIIASAVAQDAIVIDEKDESILSPLLARLMVRRLAETAETRTRLFDADDTLLADSRTLLAKTGKLEIEGLPDDRPHANWTARQIAALFDVIDFIHERREYPLYTEQSVEKGSQYDIVKRAMGGDLATQVWRGPKGRLVLAAAVPVQHYKHVLGTVMLSRTDADIDKAIYSVRIDILQIFGITLLITLMFSIYLARTLARPIRLLALAAEGLRAGQTQNTGFTGTAHLLNADAIPDLTSRRDEIGDLSGALRDLTSALAQRVGAIENFAADVSHEIKNPLTSLRSAVETAERIQDPAAQRKLMLVIRDDVDRLDRLITDISSASRLDAELSRAETTPIDVARMLGALVDFYSQPAHENEAHTHVVLTPIKGKLPVKAVELRLVQVLQNLIDNAISFSPPGKNVTLTAGQEGGIVTITVDDNGPGIPENKLQAIFDRFYSERPRTEKFGIHSGLGLSIAKQIIEAHRGTITASNRKDAKGNILGARFAVRLPLVAE
jgi:two-component system, OmpR family, sensor histidine kinase ChvG